MQIQYLKSFQKQATSLRPAQSKRLKAALKQFELEPNNTDLYNHPLMGQWKGHRSIAFGGDWRAHFQMVDGVAVFVAVGTHNQLYN
jgi:addiction module RelE/StbE family toxin